MSDDALPAWLQADAPIAAAAPATAEEIAAASAAVDKEPEPGVGEEDRPELFDKQTGEVFGNEREQAIALLADAIILLKRVWQAPKETSNELDAARELAALVMSFAGYMKNGAQSE